MFQYFKFRFHRRWRRFKRNSRVYRAWLVNYFYRHVWGKWRQLGIIRRFTAVWWGLAIVILVAVLNQSSDLESYYLSKSALPGGVYAEAVVGEIKGINPILPDNSATADASRLVFAGLMRATPSGNLEPELAESYQVSDDGLRYVFTLRQNLKWHDGVDLTAGDVAFTVAAIQHPDSRSPLAAEWRGVKVEPEGQHKITFTLPNPYVGFIHLTTVGLLPRHLLESINPSTLRVHSFNQQPVGSGPFKVSEFVAGQKIVLQANQSYFRGKPKLDGMVIRVFPSHDAALEAFAKKQVNAVAEVESQQLEAAAKIKNLELLRYRTTEQVNLFMRNQNTALASVQVRQALALATDRRQIVSEVLDDFARPLASPLLPGQLGYNGKFNQPRPNIRKAEGLLEAAGWKAQNGKRTKGGTELRLKLLTLQEPVYERVADEVKRQWQKIGVAVDIQSVGLAELIQSHIKPRQYDLLLFGITIGADPDVYPYWHSSQVNDPGLNLSQYKSAAADAALEVARITTDKDVRAGKYSAFLEAFRVDTPAIILYGTDYSYGVSSDALGHTTGMLTQPSDRFYGVENWTIKTRRSILK